MGAYTSKNLWAVKCHLTLCLGSPCLVYLFYHKGDSWENMLQLSLQVFEERAFSSDCALWFLTARKI